MDYVFRIVEGFTHQECLLELISGGRERGAKSGSRSVLRQDVNTHTHTIPNIDFAKFGDSLGSYY